MKEESRFQGREALVSPASAYGHPYGRGSTLSDPGKGDIVSGAKARARPAMLYLVAALLFQTVLADALGDAGASSEGGDYPSSFISSYALAQNVVQDDPYALDDIVRSALESAVSRGLVIYNFEPRATKDPDDFPLHKFSIWFFEGSHNLILFCTVLQMGEGPFWYCADPMNFQYHFVEGRLCIISSEDDFNGCYSLTPKNGQIDWLDDHNRYVGTSFTAFFMDTWKQGPDKWGLIRVLS